MSAPESQEIFSINYVYWKPTENQVYYELKSTTEDYESSFKSGGFTVKTEYLSPYYYVLQKYETPYIELVSYHNAKSQFIITLWNHNEELFSFFCRNAHERIECIKYLLDIASNLVQIEHTLKIIVDQKRDEDCL